MSSGHSLRTSYFSIAQLSDENVLSRRRRMLYSHPNDVESVEGLLNYENRREAGFTSD